MLTEVEHTTQPLYSVHHPVYPDRIVQFSSVAECLSPSETIHHQTGLHLINTRLWLEELTKSYGKKMTIDTIPDAEWKGLFQKYDTFWFMGIYTPSEIGRQQAVEYSESVRDAFPRLGPDEKVPKEEIVASPFAIPEYTPNPAIAADWDAWDKMVDKLHSHGKEVVVDFVPNHVARDHHWVKEHPEYFINVSEEEYLANPRDFKPVVMDTGEIVYLAHGKDPNFDSWEDTFQLNYANPAVQEAMDKVVLELMDHADGVRCDMAMLLDPGTFLRTWGNRLSKEEKDYLLLNNFWHKTIVHAKMKAYEEKRENDFKFIAEAYWDKDILGECFDYIYAKNFYDDMLAVVKGKSSGEHVRNIVQNLLDADTRKEHYRDIVFSENHDEVRAMLAFGREHSKLMAMLSGLIRPAIFMLNQGQEKGLRIRPPMQIAHFPEEEAQPDVVAYYERLLPFLRSTLVQQGDIRLPTIDVRDELNDGETDITANSSNFFAVRLAQENQETGEEVGAYVCMNTGWAHAEAKIRELTGDVDVEVWKIYEGKAEDRLDRVRDKGCYVGLIAGETQVVFYRKKKALSDRTLYQAA